MKMWHGTRCCLELNHAHLWRTIPRNSLRWATAVFLGVTCQNLLKKLGIPEFLSNRYDDKGMTLELQFQSPNDGGSAIWKTKQPAWLEQEKQLGWTAPTEADDVYHHFPYQA